MGLKVGAADVVDVKLGAAQISKVMLGAEQVWPVVPAGPVTFDYQVQSARWRAGIPAFQVDTATPAPDADQVPVGRYLITVDGTPIAEWLWTNDVNSGHDNYANPRHFMIDPSHRLIINARDADGVDHSAAMATWPHSGFIITLTKV